MIADVEDLKQFIVATVSQSEARLESRLERLERKVDNGFAGVAEAIETIHELIDDLDAKITKTHRAK